MNREWKFAKGHAASPEKDFNYGRALSFSKINFLQEATLLQNDQRSSLPVPHTQHYDDSRWASVDLPHDWGMGEGFAPDQLKIKGYRTLGGRSPENSVGWYRKTFRADLIKGCRYTLEFEGIFRSAEVWMNGIYLGSEESGYVPLVFDVTECLNYGRDEKNVITVRVDATQSELWSYEGAGIYRNVWLTRTAPVHVAQWGTFVTTPQVDVAARKAVVNVAVEVENESAGTKTVTVRNTVVAPDGRPVTGPECSGTIDAVGVGTFECEIPVTDVRLWSLSAPDLYALHTEVVTDGRVVDRYTTTFGIRTLAFDPERGFFLNGERVQIQGVCCHQDHAGVGVAVPDALNVWRIRKLKTFGCNAYRASHNPPTPAVLDACDSLGLLVLDEMRMMSASDEGLEQLSTIIRRDRNHPSVILWSLGNEEPAIQGSEKGRMIAERMRLVQRSLDSTRMCTAAMNGDWGRGFSLAVDVQGSNYFKIGDLDRLHRDLPQLPCLLTEEASTVTTRGIYRTDAGKGYHQSYDRDHPGWGSTAQEWMRYVDARPFIGGAFVWTGFDYGGESLMHFWPGVAANFGILDYCGFPKDAYWYYKAWWTQEPVLHILPHWNGLGTDSVDVHLYTNLDEVELLLNGKSLGRKSVGKYDIPAWRVKYEPGKLVARGKKGKQRYKEVLETTGQPARLELTGENGPTVKADDREVAIVTVRVTDDRGRTVPTADCAVRFEIENGVFRGIGNGDPSSHVPDRFPPGEAVSRRVFSGYAQLIVSADRSGRPLVIRASAEGLGETRLEIPVEGGSSEKK